MEDWRVNTAEENIIFNWFYRLVCRQGTVKKAIINLLIQQTSPLNINKLLTFMSFILLSWYKYDRKMEI